MSCNDGVVAYVGLGSNLGDPAGRLRQAIAALGDISHTRVRRCSSFYRSAPVGMSNQPDFVNAVCEIETALDPAALLQAMLEVERRHGRVRDGEKGGPRTLDLDLLLYGERVLHEPGLDIPHPRLHERAFVLQPLAELLPGMIIPDRGALVDLIAACRDQRIERLGLPQGCGKVPSI